MADPRHPRKFSEEFKHQIVALYDSGKSVRELQEEYDIGHSTLHRWIKGIHEHGSTHAKDQLSPQEKELIALRKENKQLKMEVDILKQAALIFAQK